MKQVRYTLLYLFLSSFFLTFGQNVERTFRPGFFSTPNFIVPISDNKILIGGDARNNTYINRVDFLTMVDTLGNVLWEYDFSQDLSNWPKISVQDIIIIDGNIWVAVRAAPYCDTASSSNNYFRMSEEGEVLEFIPAGHWNANIIQYEDLIIGGNWFSVSVLDSTFQPHDFTQNFSFPNSNNFQITDIDYTGSKLLLSSINDIDPTCGLRTLAVNEWFSLEYYISDQCVGYSNIQNIEHNDNGETFIQNDNRIIVLDSNLNELTEVLLSDMIDILNFKTSDNKLIIISDSIDERSLKVYDQSLNLVFDLELENNLKMIPIDAFIDGNKIFVTGEERSNHWIDVGYPDHYSNESSSSIFFRSYDMNSVNDFPGQDIGISAVTVDEFPIASPGWCPTTVPECGPSGLINYKDIYVTITNYGNEVLNECTVNTKAHPCGSCSTLCSRAFIYSVKYENLNLSPGASVEVLFGDVEFDDQPHTATHQLCLWTSNPNNIIDKNIDNDLGCLESELLVSIDQLEEQPFEIKIFPNPSTLGKVNLSIDSINEEKEIKVFNTQGVEIKSYFLEKNSNSLEIETSSFSAGIYYVMVKTDSFSVGKKLIVN